MKITDYADLVETLQKTAEKFYTLGYQRSNGGNLSVRIPGKDLMLVKGTDVAFDELCADHLVITDFDGNVIEGTIRPSKEALLHGALYRAVPEANAILHCHSPYATAWAAEHEVLDFSTHHSALKLAGEVPVFDSHSYAVPKAYFPQIIQFFETHPGANAFLLRAHGQVTLGKDLRTAAHLAELVEETAQISILSQRK